MSFLKPSNPSEGQEYDFERGEISHDADRGEVSEIVEILQTDEAIRLAVLSEFQITGAKVEDSVASAVKDTVCEVLSRLLSVRKPPLEVHCLAIAFDYPWLGRLPNGKEIQGLRDVAAFHGVTVAAVSRRALQITDQFGLPPSRYQKSAKSRAIYRQTNRKKTK